MLSFYIDHQNVHTQVKIVGHNKYAPLLILIHSLNQLITDSRQQYNQLRNNTPSWARDNLLASRQRQRDNVQQ